MIVFRNTKYTKDVMNVISKFGHITNSQILDILQRKYPDLSATTVHRITTRLLERGQIAKAPSDLSGAVRFDSNLLGHDHFICSCCGDIKDIDVLIYVQKAICRNLKDCRVTGRLAVYGNCNKCLKEG